MRKSKFSRSLFWTCYSFALASPVIYWVRPAPVVIQILSITFSILYVSAHSSLPQAPNDASRGRSLFEKNISLTEAKLFPIFGSCTLLTFYMAYKYLSQYWVNVIITTHLAGFILINISMFLQTSMDLIFPNRDSKVIFQIPRPEHVPPHIQLPNNMTVDTMLHHIIALSIIGIWLYTKHWTVQNLIAIIMSIQAIRFIKLSRFGIAAVLLSGLLIYDVFWVFSTDVMLTVAKKFDPPAKLIFPNSSDPSRHSFLGLGDIVLPGLLIALTLRFDYHQFIKKTADNAKGSQKEITNYAELYKKNYFNWSMILYHQGILLAYVVVHYFERAQPALLYLVPANFLGVLIPAMYRGEIGEVWNYSDVSIDASSENVEKDKVQ